MIRKEPINLTRRETSKIENQTAKNVKCNPKRFWSYVSAKLEETTEISNCSVFNTEQNNSPELDDIFASFRPFTDVITTEKMVFIKFAELERNKSPGSTEFVNTH